MYREIRIQTYVDTYRYARMRILVCSHAAMLRERLLSCSYKDHSQWIVRANVQQKREEKGPKIGSKFIRVPGRAATSLGPLLSRPRPSPSPSLTARLFPFFFTPFRIARLHFYPPLAFSFRLFLFSSLNIIITPDLFSRRKNILRVRKRRETEIFGNIKKKRN